MNATATPTPQHDAVRDGATRAVAAVGLAGVALIHLLDTPDTITETPYLGWMFIALEVGCIVVAAGVLFSGSRLAWSGALMLPLLTVIGFVLSRTTGLPHSDDDIGNWSEPLGMASLFVEGALIALSSAALAFAPRAVTARRATTIPHRLPADGGRLAQAR